jgi:hypothetical protein
MDVVRVIAASPLAEGTVDQPADPVSIVSTTVLP